jgi:uncharacterized membrane protein
VRGLAWGTATAANSGCFQSAPGPIYEEGRERFCRKRAGYRPEVLAIRERGSAVAEVQESVEVNVPLRTAYNQWTQFEEFPQFMEGVESVKQLDDTRLHWVAEIGGKRHEWDAEITHQEPDRRVAWRSVDGKYNSGQVTFKEAGPDRTIIDVEMMYDPEGLMESLGSAMGADDRRVKGDLNRFKELIEGRGSESGAWRGEVQKGDVKNR